MDLQFGPYRLKRAERLLLGPDGPVELSARSFDILAALLRRPDEVIGKSELFDVAWPGMVVEDNTLQVHVSALRKALTPGMIVTVHGRGYKYAGPLPSAFVAGAAENTPADRMQQAGTETAPDAYKPVIAVLPFTNMSGDPGQEYFSDGITEDIIVELSRYRALNVISRNSSARFKGAAVDVRAAGRQLGARYLVEGSVRKIGGNIRVTAQLLEAATASHVWAERYDRELHDVFAVQDELVRRLVSTIAGHVEMHTDSRAKSKGTESLDAYDCWLRANHGFVLWSLDGNAACERMLKESIRKDPTFARAHASLAFCYIRNAFMMPGSPQIPAFERAAVDCAQHAVRLDQAEARAYNALGWSQMYACEFERAHSAFMLSAALNPHDGHACIDRALAWAFLGDQKGADEAAASAAILNPLGGEWFASVQAYVRFMARRYEAAEAFFALTSRHSADALAWHAANLTCLGRPQQAADLMRQSLQELAGQWCGPSPMRAADFIAWFRHNNMLRREEDLNHLFNSLPRAELERFDQGG